MSPVRILARSTASVLSWLVLFVATMWLLVERQWIYLGSGLLLYFAWKWSLDFFMWALAKLTMRSLEHMRRQQYLRMAFGTVFTNALSDIVMVLAGLSIVGMLTDGSRAGIDVPLALLGYGIATRIFFSRAHVEQETSTDVSLLVYQAALTVMVVLNLLQDPGPFWGAMIFIAVMALKTIGHATVVLLIMPNHVRNIHAAERVVRNSPDEP